MDPNHPLALDPGTPGVHLPTAGPVAIHALADPPRLAVRHVGVWLVASAVYLAVDRLWFTSRVPATNLDLALAALYSLGAGAALSGLLYLAARQHHRLPFPSYPGEYLWVALGLNVLFDWGVHTIGMGSSPVDAIGPFASVTFSPQQGWLLAAVQSFLVVAFLIPAILAVLFAFFPILKAGMFLTAAGRCGSRHWRVFFLAGSAVFVVYLPLFCIEPRTWLSLYQVFESGLGLALVAVLWLDRRPARPYPWTHWLGVAVSLWYATVAATILLTGRTALS
jgi:hypothetical protein